MDKFINEVRLTVEIEYQKVVQTAKGVLKDFNFIFYTAKDKKAYIRGVAFNKDIVETNYNKNKKYIITARLGINQYTNKDNQKVVWHKLTVIDIAPENNLDDRNFKKTNFFNYKTRNYNYDEIENQILNDNNNKED